MFTQATLTLLALLPTLLALPRQSRSTGVTIAAGRDGLCLSVVGTPGVGSPVASVACSTAFKWDINPGSGSVVLTGTNFALDAGSSPGNNGLLKIWTSYPGLYQQTWYLTADERIAITGGNQCLDEGVNGVQTYQCTTGNTNQIWHVGGTTPPPPPPPVSTTVVVPSSTTSSVPPSSPVPPPPVNNGRQIHPNGNTKLCVSVQNGYAAIGASVAITDCFSATDPYAYLQLWDYSTTAPGAIRLSKSPNVPSLCLDAGNNPSNGSGMKVWTCYDGLLQQTWSYSGKGLASLANGQCLDVQAESFPGSQKPYRSEKNLQTWFCSAPDPQQAFTS